MSWATHHIRKLQSGQTAVFRPRGNSMSGKISSGQQVTVVPASSYLVQVGDIVLCTVAGRHYLHLVKAVDIHGSYLIGNNQGKINGWTSENKIYGICVDVDGVPTAAGTAIKKGQRKR
jgi:hypothetical protein